VTRMDDRTGEASAVPAPAGISFFRWTHGLINRLVYQVDGALVLVSGFLSTLLPFHVPADSLNAVQILVLSLVEMTVFLALMGRMGAYWVEHYGNRLRSAATILGALIPAWTAGYVVLASFAPALVHPPQGLIGWHLLQLALLLLAREVERRAVRAVLRRGVLGRRVVVIGTGAVAERTIAQLRAAQDRTNEIIAVYRLGLEEAGTASVAGIPVTGDFETLGGLAENETVDLVVIALPWSRAPEIFRTIQAVSWIAADVAIPFEEGGVIPNDARLMPMGEVPALQVINRSFKGSQGVTKMAEDYAVATLAILLVSPILLLAAIAIRMEEKGPILFRQWRPGYGRKPFAILKFRTMKVNPHDDATVGTTGRDDPRITRVGAVLRRLSIDELPQLFNVLRGEMSVVGPRPYVANMLVGNERFSDLARNYAARHRIKPGLTGYAAAYGMRSYALRSPENARKSIEMDLYYMTNWSLWLDLKIMVRTVMVGLAGRNVF